MKNLLKLAFFSISHSDHGVPTMDRDPNLLKHINDVSYQLQYDYRSFQFHLSFSSNKQCFHDEMYIPAFMSVRLQFLNIFFSHMHLLACTYHPWEGRTP